MLRAVPRYFRPSILLNVGTNVVAVDELQPVATVLDKDGVLQATVSWEHLRGPDRSTWPARSACADNKCFWVDDGSGSDIVQVTLSNIGPTVENVQSIPSESDLTRVFSTFVHSTLTVPTRSPTWICRSTLHENETIWNASAEQLHGSDHESGVLFDIGRGSICSAVAAGSALFVIVRRAPKRPWHFRANSEIVRIAPDSATPEIILAQDALDISYYCRAIHPDAPPVSSLVLDKVRYAMNSENALAGLDVSDVGFAVRNLLDPVFELSFRHPSRPGVRLIRAENLITEFGFPQDAGTLGIFLEEDLEFGLIPPMTQASDGILYI